MTSLDGRRFHAAANSAGGQVTEQTQFDFSQDGDLIFARYGGGSAGIVKRVVECPANISRL
jgi:hypothetical protein